MPLNGIVMLTVAKVILKISVTPLSCGIVNRQRLEKDASLVSIFSKVQSLILMERLYIAFGD